MSDRQELRRKLREKINSKRNNCVSGVNDVAKQMKADPTTTMLAMGLDDLHILNNAKHIMRDPHSFLKNTIDTTKSVEEEEEEEAPPL